MQHTDNPESVVTRQLHKMTRVGNMAGTKAYVEDSRSERKRHMLLSDQKNEGDTGRGGKSCKELDPSSPHHGPSQKSKALLASGQRAA